MPAGRGMGMMGGKPNTSIRLPCDIDARINAAPPPAMRGGPVAFGAPGAPPGFARKPRLCFRRGECWQTELCISSPRQLPYGTAWLRTTRLPTTSAGLRSIEGRSLAWDTKFCNASCMSSGFGSLCCTIESNGQMRMPGLAVLLRLTCS